MREWLIFQASRSIPGEAMPCWVLGRCLHRRVDRRAGGTAFAFEGGAAAVAFDVHLEDGGRVDEAVDDGERHRLIGEDFSPFAERLVGGDQQGSPLLSGTDEFQQDAGFGVIRGDIGEIVEDQQVVLRAWRWRIRERVHGGRFAAVGRNRWFG